MTSSSSLDELIEALRCLPGVGPKSAQRMTYHLLQRERQDRAIASIEQDPFVRDVVDLFDASIDESTIKPV